jgi:hypothetical protein
LNLCVGRYRSTAYWRALKVAHLQMAKVRLALHAGREQLDLILLSARLYSGSLHGALLKDAIKKNPIDGTGNVQLFITTGGALNYRRSKASRFK